jgi:glutathione S-transferase
MVEDESGWAELESIWPIRKFPVVRDGDEVVIESSIIIEYLALHHPAPASLIPSNGDAALRARFMDRVFDNYVMTPMQALVADRMRARAERDTKGVADARAMLEKTYSWLEGQLHADRWAAGFEFTLADCAAAPALFYADWVHPIGDRYPHTRDYRRRLLARPAVARTVDEARPYRKFFPQGAPDRD